MTTRQHKLSVQYQHTEITLETQSQLVIQNRNQQLYTKGYQVEAQYQNIRFVYSTLKKDNILNKSFAKPVKQLLDFHYFIDFLKHEAKPFPVISEGINSQISDAKKDADSVP